MVPRDQIQNRGIHKDQKQDTPIVGDKGVKVQGYRGSSGDQIQNAGVKI